MFAFLLIPRLTVSRLSLYRFQGSLVPLFRALAQGTLCIITGGPAFVKGVKIRPIVRLLNGSFSKQIL